MKRRNFLKRSVVAVGAVIVSGPAILRATKKKQLDKGIVYAPYVPIITASMPELHPGEIGILYGLSGCGKSKVLRDMFLQKPVGGNQYWDVESLKDKALSTILNHPNSGTLYIDGFNLIRLDNSDVNPSIESVNINIIMDRLHKKARKEQCRIWITSQINKYSVKYDRLPIVAVHRASVIIHIRHEDGYIYGDIVKNKYDNKGTIWFGKAKYLGLKNEDIH